MSEPHKVSGSKDWSKLSIKELTAQDMADILGEIAISKRLFYTAYELFAIQWARMWIEEEIRTKKEKS